MSNYYEEERKRMKAEKELAVKRMKKWIAIGIALLAILITIFNTIGVVPTNHTGIWKRLGVLQEQSVREGWHIKIPFIDTIESVSNLVQTVTVFSSQTDKDATTKETAETKDQQLIMSYSFEIQYQLIPSQSFVIYKNYGKSYERILVTSNIIPIVKQAFAQFESEEITVNKETIAKYVQKELQAFTQTFGINILRVNFQSYDFTEEYNAILEERAALKAQVVNEQLRQDQERVAAQTAYDVAVKRAEQDAETARIAADNEKKVALVKAGQEKETALIQAQARAEAQKIDADNEAYVKTKLAEADKTARIAKAEATKAELEAQAAGLTELVVQREFIQKWDGKLIPSFGGGSSINVADFTDIYKQFLNMGDQQ